MNRVSGPRVPPLLNRRSRGLSPAKRSFEWSPMTHISLKRWFLWMKHRLTILMQKKMSFIYWKLPFFSFTKEGKDDTIKWKGHVTLFLGLGRYNYGKGLREEAKKWVSLRDYYVVIKVYVPNYNALFLLLHISTKDFLKAPPVQSKSYHSSLWSTITCLESNIECLRRDFL